MKGQTGSLVVVAAIILALYLWMQSQNKTRGIASKKPTACTSSSLKKTLANLFGGKKPAAPKGGGGSGGGLGGGSGSSSGAGTAGGAKMCNKAPDVSCCLAYAGKDANGNEIYQRADGSLVGSDGSPYARCDIACNEGACVGTVCNPPVCNPQDVCTAQPCSNPGACAGCSGTGCFTPQGSGCAVSIYAGGGCGCC